MKPVVIFGITSYARIAAHYLTVDSPHTVAAFTVDRHHMESDSLNGVPVVPYENLKSTHPPTDFSMLVAVGFSRVNRARTEVYARCRDAGYDLVSYINSRATHWGKISVGDNTFIFENNVIQPFVSIGSNCILWSGSNVLHDATVEDHCFIASHAVISGNVVIGHSCFVGANATFRHGVKVAPRCVIGAAALVMRDTEEGDILSVRGTPARDDLKSWDLKSL